MRARHTARMNRSLFLKALIVIALALVLMVPVAMIQSGAIEGGPQVVDNTVYWGVGAESGGLFPNSVGVFKNAGSRVFAFQLPRGNDDDDHD